MKALHQLFTLLTGGISTAEFERFIREEIPGAYSFFRRAIRKSENEKRGFRRSLRIAWYLLLAFLEKLTPVRRLVYAISILFFLLWLSNGRSENALYAFILVNLILILEVADKLLTKNELVIAREIQMGLLPSEPATPPGFDVSAYSDVANSVGGDYYDAIACTDGSVLYVLADVSGKGISAALYTTTVQTALRLFAVETNDPRELTLRLDGYLRGQLRRSYFLTLLIIRVRPDGSTTVCRAGHPGAFLYRAATHEVVPIRPNGAAIGMAAQGGAQSESILRQALMQEEVSITPGDILVMVSDGLLEATNTYGQEYGENRISALLKAFPGSGAGVVKERLIGDLRDFRQGANLRDDVTLIVLRRKTDTAA